MIRTITPAGAPAGSLVQALLSDRAALQRTLAMCDAGGWDAVSGCFSPMGRDPDYRRMAEDRLRLVEAELE